MKKRSKSSFKGKVQQDAERQRAAGSSYGYLNLPTKVSVFSPEPGSRTKLDFMPYLVTDKNHPDRDPELDIAMPGTLWYKRPFKVHRNVGAGDGDTEVCPTSIGKKCPICELRAKRLREGAEKSETDELKYSQRVLYVVIPIEHKKFESKPHIFDISQWNFQNMLNEELEEDEDNGVFPDLEEGKTLKIRWASKTIGKGKPFSEASRIDFLERDIEYDESILKSIPNLDEVLNVKSYEELEAKFLEMEDDEEDEDEREVWDDEEDVKKTKKTRTTRKKKREIEEEEEDEEPDEELEEDEDDELPVKSFTRKKKRVIEEPEDEEPEEDEDEEPEEDEDEEPEPPKKSFTRKKKRSEPVEEEEEDEEPEEDEDEEPEPPVRKTNKTTRKKTSKSGGKDRCPFGHRFGVDANKFDDCDECELWDECDEAKES